MCNIARFGVNLASMWKLAIVYVIKNNMYVKTTAISYVANIPNMADGTATLGSTGLV